MIALDVVKESIAAYRQQQAEMTAALQQLEQQKQIGLKTLDMCEGAIQALEQLALATPLPPPAEVPPQE